MQPANLKEMSSKSKSFQFGSKRSQSLSTSKPGPQTAAEHLKTKRSQFALLASLPFRYAFTNNSFLLKQHSSDNSPPSGCYQAASLLVRGSVDESNSEVGASEENLTKQPSASSSDIDDYTKPISLVFNREDLTKQVSLPENDGSFYLANVPDEEEPSEAAEAAVVIPIGGETVSLSESKMNSSSAVNTSISESREGDEVAAAAKKSAIRRHHSAPQSEAKWLQVLKCVNEGEGLTKGICFFWKCLFRSVSLIRNVSIYR